ncbi:AarF/UbiB family protein [Streptomyces sp. NPDC048383]|uniref:AarF/UbiB family protein n=1 Tax=Streptomyces sp. NPDC048383 TaxID=3155386 RepID=UPI00343FEE73
MDRSVQRSRPRTVRQGRRWAASPEVVAPFDSEHVTAASMARVRRAVPTDGTTVAVEALHPYATSRPTNDLNVLSRGAGTPDHAPTGVCHPQHPPRRRLQRRSTARARLRLVARTIPRPPHPPGRQSAGAVPCRRRGCGRHRTRSARSPQPGPYATEPPAGRFRPPGKARKAAAGGNRSKGSWRVRKGDPRGLDGVVVSVNTLVTPGQSSGAGQCTPAAGASPRRRPGNRTGLAGPGPLVTPSHGSSLEETCEESRQASSWWRSA